MEFNDFAAIFYYIYKFFAAHCGKYISKVSSKTMAKENKE